MRQVRPRRSPRIVRYSASAAAALMPLSLLTAPEMKPNIGWKATSRPAATAATGWRGSTSRSTPNAHSATSAPSSAETSRIAVSCE